MLEPTGAIPISSAHALTIPAFLERRILSKLVRNGSMALLKRKAEPGHPCETPEKKMSTFMITPLCA